MLQASDNQSGTLQPRSVIDGQQRLTTLQLVADAMAAVLEERGLEQLAAQLEGLVHNPAHYVNDGDTLKLQHTNRDRAAFLEVMQADPPIQYAQLDHAGSLIARAHQFFASQVDTWLDEAGPDTVLARAGVLAAVVTRALQIVVIDLRADENSQEIFETLNARGTPLTAADLIKNLVFQRLTAEGVDTKRAYVELWPFDTAFWEKTVSSGRYPISRSSLFLNQWLVSRVGEEVGPGATFTRFKHFVDHETDQPMSALLGRIQDQAATYRQWLERADDPHADLSVVEMCVYRTQSVEVEAIKPVQIWLHEPGRALDPATIDAATRVVESWVMRRALLRLPTSGLGRVVAELINAQRDATPADLVGRVETFLSRQNAASTYWPGDDEIRTALRTDPVYRRLKRRRMRMFLETAEDFLRGYGTAGAPRAGGRVSRSGFPIENLLPQKWAAHWPVDGLAAEIDRDAHVHRLGNLTLLTTSLNSSVSNAAWDGEKGKWSKLQDHDVFLLNRPVAGVAEDRWDEARIDDRSELLTAALLSVWAVPAGHNGVIDNPVAPADSAYVGIRELVAGGILTVGTVLRARPGHWGVRLAEVTADCNLVVDGKEFSSPSAAGHHVRQSATNGWWFWEMPDGRRLKDLRAELVAEQSRPGAGPDPGLDANSVSPPLSPAEHDR